MLHPFSSQVDWNQLLKHRQGLINQSNMKENMRRQTHDYAVNDLVLILNKEVPRGKLSPSTLPEGPWRIQQVYTNGTVTIIRNSYMERMNIRHLRPYFER